MVTAWPGSAARKAASSVSVPDGTVAEPDRPAGAVYRGVVGTGGASVRPLHRLPARACGPCHSREYGARSFSFAVDDATGSCAPGVQGP